MKTSITSTLPSKTGRHLIAAIAMLGMAAASISTASAANTNVVATGTLNGSNKTITEATGNSVNVTNYASNIAIAFANDTGGVWDFDNLPTNWSADNGDTITLHYGVSQSNNLILTLNSTNGINQGNVASEATSGAFELGLSGDATTRTFIPDKPLLSIGIFNTNRYSGATSTLTVTFADNTTASDSGADGNANYWHEISATLDNPIKSFSLTQTGFIRYDDMAFVTTEPGKQ